MFTSATPSTKRAWDSQPRFSWISVCRTPVRPGPLGLRAPRVRKTRTSSHHGARATRGGVRVVVSSMKQLLAWASLLQVGLYNLHQRLRRLGLLRGGVVIGIHQVKADMALNDFSHQAIERAPAGGNRHQHRRTVVLLDQCVLHGVKLSTNAVHAVQKLFLVPD